MSWHFSASDLAHAVGGTMTQPFHATGVSIDTRTIEPGDLFVALQTSHGDGHRFVADALAKGAAGALVHRQHGLPDAAPLLVAGDTLAGLTALGAFGRERFEGAVIAVTGSVGKTTTKEMLRAVLAPSGQVHAAQASFNNHWGVPLTLARLPEKFDFCVVEIGMNHPGEIAPLARLAAPDVALVTNVEAAHIGHMGSIEAIADEKACIFQGVLQGGTAVLPADSPMLRRLRAANGTLREVTFGVDTVQDIQEDSEGSDVTAEIGGTILRFRVGAPGRHMVRNALAALTAAQAAGADLAAGGRALAHFAPVAGRGVRRPIFAGRATLIDESYNASGASMRAALALLKLQPAQRRIAVLGDMLELGAYSIAEHENLADAVDRSADLLYACGPWMRYLFEAVAPARRAAYTHDSDSLAEIVASQIRDGDAILVKGSLGSRMRVVVEALHKAEHVHAGSA